jgi:GntR family transcriptional regulator, rspAB operon transcriptional repressor
MLVCEICQTDSGVADITLRSIDSIRTASVADLVFEELYDRVVTLDLPPGSRLSEADVARQMGVSRQPVRDAFYRLSQLGFLQIRPQRPTTVARISEDAVHQARFIRTALEVETTAEAAERLTGEGLAELDTMLDEQRKAVAADDRLRFHALDDEFHRTICRLSGHEYAWTLIRDNKSHMDRVRWLSLASGAGSALSDHARILDALRIRDGRAAADCMRLHLSQIEGILAQIRSDHGEYFEGWTP